MPDKKKYINFSLVFLFIIGFPAIQTLTRILPENRLHGVNYGAPLPALNWDDWVHFRYQPRLNRHVEEEFGFRTFFIRLYNQVDYTVFRQPHGTGVVIGKEGYLFEKWFITSYYGRDYVGNNSINFKIRQLKKVQSYFKQNGKELVVLISPGKADFFPEYIPDRYKYSPDTTNYSVMSEGIRKAGIPLLDFNSLFVKIKDSTNCALFPKTGTHWSQYGACVGADTLSGFVGALLNRPMPEIHLEQAVPRDTVMSSDSDLEDLMNLFFPLPRLPLCYPQMITQSDNEFNLPTAIVIGDSFFWGMFNLPLTNRVFKDVKYWYYNSSVYPDSYTDSLQTSMLKFPEALNSADLIILMANPSSIQNIGWGFQERVLDELYNPERQQEYMKLVKEYIQAIHNTPEWEKNLQEEAQKKGISKDSLILFNARYMADQYQLTHDLF